MKKAIGVILVLSLVVAGTWYVWQREQAPFYFAGTLEATKIDVPARLATVIAETHVHEGDKVQLGQPLFDLACEDIKIQKQWIDSNFERASRLSKVGSMTQEAFDEVQARKRENDLKLSWCSVPAPLGGTVLTVYHQTGEWVAPGVKLLTLADLSEVWAYVYVPETMLARLNPGMGVPGFLPELPRKKFVGRIEKINEEAEFTPKNVQTREERSRLVFGVKVRFDNRERILKPGMPIEVDLPGGNHE